MMATSPWSIIPFAIMLSCIAIFPLIPATQKHWEKSSIQLVVALLLGVPVGVWVWLSGSPDLVGHTLVEYAQFICLLLCLFIVSGGIFLRGDLRATPRNNTIFLAVGGVLASFIGTTGAAMLLIRPIINTNSERKHTTPTVIFAIFIIANCGGLLTPLGDPPLFLGMLRGVPFFWTMNLVWEWLFVNGLLLLVYFAVDRRNYAREDAKDIEFDNENSQPIKIIGKVHFIFFATIILAVAFVPSVHLTEISHSNAVWTSWVPWREILMLSAAACSLLLGDKRTRYIDNGFEWEPIKEVAALFIGIFLTMVPALSYLAKVAPKMPLNRYTLFWFSGGLSSILDNAPTYATFFEMARQLPGDIRVAGVPEIYLAAISLGAVLCGAITYIGNGPNFMVKSLAENKGIKMPSFVGYLKWSLIYLVPVLFSMWSIFIVKTTIFIIIGIVVAIAICVRMVILSVIHVHPEEKRLKKSN